jgi:hypothetical protein
MELSSGTHTEDFQVCISTPTMADHIPKYQRIDIPGPNFDIDLSALDALHPVHFSRRLLIFRSESDRQTQQQLQSLELGLRRLVAQCPVLGGLVVTTGGVHAIRHQDAGLGLIIRDLRSEMPTYRALEQRNFAPSLLPYDDLVPVPLQIGKSSTAPACMVQFSVIDGGSIVTWAMSHSVADGRGTDILLKLLSENVRLAQTSSKDFLSDGVPEWVGIDRSAIKNFRSDVPFDVAHHAAYSAGLTPPATPPAAETDTMPPSPSLATIVVALSRAGLERLKKACQPEEELGWISSHDAICALLWRTHVLTSGDTGKNEESTRIFFPSDARQKLGLDKEWVPNAVYQVTASVSLADMREMEDVKALRMAASAVRTALSSINSEDVKSYFQHLETVGWVDWGFLAMTPVDFAMGTDWSSEVYADDWGEAFGALRSWRYPSEPGSIRMGAILPKRPDGSAEVMLTVGEDQVELVERMWAAWM